jgi:hypothetical protein
MNLLVGEPMRQGVDAAVDEARLLSAHDWGFHFEDVGYNQVWIWHGVNDANAPIVRIEYLAKRLPIVHFARSQMIPTSPCSNVLRSLWTTCFLKTTENHNIAMPGRLLPSLLLFHHIFSLHEITFLSLHIGRGW